MRTEREQAMSPEPKRSRKLILNKETIKNLKVNSFPTTVTAEYPTGCDCSESCTLTVPVLRDG